MPMTAQDLEFNKAKLMATAPRDPEEDAEATAQAEEMLAAYDGDALTLIKHLFSAYEQIVQQHHAQQDQIAALAQAFPGLINIHYAN